MADKQAGVYASAISVLKRAIELDSANRLEEAVVCYQEGLQLLIDYLKDAPADKKEGIRAKVKEYMERAELIKQKVKEDKEAERYHEQIQIENNSTGHSYETLLGRFLDEQLTEVHVEDPYVRTTHQMYNFLRFCELLVKSKAPVKTVRLTTGQDDQPDQRRHQNNKLGELQSSLHQYNVTLEVTYSETLHDREIRYVADILKMCMKKFDAEKIFFDKQYAGGIKFNNGWIVKIGRGLDIYKATDSKFSIGYCDFDLRKCHKTTVDIFHSKHLNKSYSASGT